MLTLSKYKLTLQKKSEVYRNWIFDISSLMIKTITGNKGKAKKKNLWKAKPYDWPNDQPFYDPRNTPYMSLRKHENLLGALLRYCDTANIALDEYILFEVSAWKENDFDTLRRHYVKRSSLQNIESAIDVVKTYKSTIHLDQVIVTVDCHVGVQGEPMKMMSASEAIRSLACILCKVYHEKNPDLKTNSIWLKKPIGWPDDIPFEDPNNKSKRKEKYEDRRLVRALIGMCEEKARAKGKETIIPPEYQDIVSAFKANEDERLVSIVAYRRNLETVRKNLLRLQNENLLQNLDVRQKMSSIGLKSIYDKQDVGVQVNSTDWSQHVNNSYLKRKSSMAQAHEAGNNMIKRYRSVEIWPTIELQQEEEERSSTHKSYDMDDISCIEDKYVQTENNDDLHELLESIDPKKLVIPHLFQIDNDFISSLEKHITA